jgi:hypothetical protein
MELVVERAAGLLSEGFLARQRGRKREVHFSIPTLSKRETASPGAPSVSGPSGRGANGAIIRRYDQTDGAGQTLAGICVGGNQIF